MITIQFDPLNVEEVMAAHKVTSALMPSENKVVKQESAAEVVPEQESAAEVVSEQESAAEAVPEIDAREMPWDARIHASTKTFLTNGNWKNKRGVDAALLAEVEAELLGHVSDEELAELAADNDKPGALGQSTPEVTIDDVREVLAIKANANRDAIRSKLDEMKTQSVTFMDPSNYAEFKTFLEGLE